MAATSDAVDVLGAVVTLAMIALFVRPGSQGPSLVTGFLSGFSTLIGSATGGIWKPKAGGYASGTTG